MKSHSARKRFVEKKTKERELVFSKIEALEKENTRLKRDLSHLFEEIYMIHREIHDGQYCPFCKDLAKTYMEEAISEEKEEK